MVSENKITLRGLAVWFVCAIFFMYEFLLRTVIGTFQLPIMEDMQLSPFRFALLSSTVYQFAYSLMQIPVGIITNRFGLKRTLLSAVLICVLANIGFSVSHQFFSATLFRILMGLGSSFGFVCVLMAVYDWLPRKNAALFIGLSQFIGTMGPMLAAGPMNILSQANIADWREVYLGLGIVGSVVAILVLIIVDNNREGFGKFIVLSRPDKRIADHLAKVVKDPQKWYIIIFSACTYFSIEYLSENEGVQFLQLKGFSAYLSSFMITFSWLGYAFGCPLLGFISDYTQKRKPVMIFAIILLAISLIGIIYLPLPPSFMVLAFFMVGIGASGQSVAFATMAEQCCDEYLAIGLSFNNAMGMLLGAVNAPLIGSILMGLERSHGSVTLVAFKQAFLVIFALLLIGFISITFAVSETFCKSRKTSTKLKV